MRHLVLAALLVLAACGSSSDPAATPDGAFEVSVLTGEVATVDGSTFDLASLQGQDLVVWFWAPW